MSLPKSLPGLIRRARKAAQKTQAELATILGVSKTAVVHWETGVNEPSLVKKVELSELLGIRLSDLLPQIKGLSADDLTSEEQQWVVILRRLEPRHRKALLAAAESLRATSPLARSHTVAGATQC